MYPNVLFLGMTMYDILFALGVLGALVVFRVLSDKRGREARLFNFSLVTGVAAIIGGVVSSVLFQAFYNFGATGVFEINASTGMTFYGGLIGGVVVFLSVYLGVGHFVFKDKSHLADIADLADTAACSIAVAHATGRLGCFFAGCCHGIAAEPPLGIYMEFAGEHVLPVQLYESVFLYVLTALLIRRYLAKKPYNMSIYMAGYGLWRFFIEYLRGDERGASLIKFLSPSQLTAVILIIGGAALFYIQYRLNRRKAVAHESEDKP